MGTNTTNHALYKPAVSETGWGPDVSGNFDTLDQLLVGFNSAGTALALELLTLERRSSAPPDSAIPTGETALYYKTGEASTLYQKPSGGSESEVGGGSGSTTSPELSEGATLTNADSPASASADTEYVVDLQDGNVEVDLSASPADHEKVKVKVVNAGTNDCTVDGNGNNVEGDATDEIIGRTTKTYEYITEAAADAGEWVEV